MTLKLTPRCKLITAHKKEMEICVLNTMLVVQNR
ncbi:Uncharacterised protein [Vibrio cholerae]|nr:Uncharacterised protein [Vibrio cholerae]